VAVQESNQQPRGIRSDYYLYNKETGTLKLLENLSAASRHALRRRGPQAVQNVAAEYFENFSSQRNKTHPHTRTYILLCFLLQCIIRASLLVIVGDIGYFL
jgi:hypothetical protein